MTTSINWAQTMGALRTIAERDPNDIIANSASALAVRLESLNTLWGTRVQDLSIVDWQLIEYALRTASLGCIHKAPLLKTVDSTS